MEILSTKIYDKKKAPIKIMQFGEGNFLRAFIDWMIKKMNDQKDYEGQVVLVQPLASGRVKNLMEQDGLYTLILQGYDQGEAKRTHEIIDVIADGLDPYTEYQKLLDYAVSTDLEVVISNTTEAGIVYVEEDVSVDLDHCCPSSFPAKLLAVLKARYRALGDDKPLSIIPLELIDDNGDKLKEVLLKLAAARKEDEGFINYLNNVTHYTSTLVDRIVPGFPRDEFEELCQEYGYIDNNMVKGEYFDFFVLKKNPAIEKVFPVHKYGLEAYYVDDIHPYKKRKVRVLNGAHTALVPVAYLCGHDEVGESLKDPLIYRFLKNLVDQEVVPTVEVEGIQKFADSVFERFLNPYVHHQLLSIALNSLPKFKERDLGTILDNIDKGKTPKHLLFSLAALLLFLKGTREKDGIKEIYKIKDSQANLDFIEEIYDRYERDPEKLVRVFLSNTVIFGEDLTKHEVILKEVTKYYEKLIKDGIRPALEDLLND